MRTSRWLEKEAAAMALLLAVVGIACTDATAMGRAETGEETGTVPGTVTAPVSAGSYRQGYELGLRNGGNTVQRLRDRTIGTEGCSAVRTLQNALIQVTRSVKAPRSKDDALVAGFYRGYIDAVRQGVRDARADCGIRSFDEGGFAGVLYGTLLCRLTTVKLETVEEFRLESLYEGWSGGSSDVLRECRTAATLTLESCGQSELDEILSVSVEQSCSDIVL